MNATIRKMKEDVITDLFLNANSKEEPTEVWKNTVNRLDYDEEALTVEQAKEIAEDIRNKVYLKTMDDNVTQIENEL